MFGSMHTYTSMLDRASMEVERMSVSVVGTGPFGLALSSRLAEAGAEVRLGSRDVNNVRGQVAPGAKLVHNKVRSTCSEINLIKDRYEQMLFC